MIENCVPTVLRRNFHSDANSLSAYRITWTLAVLGRKSFALLKNEEIKQTTMAVETIEISFTVLWLLELPFPSL